MADLGRPKKFKTTEELELKINSYFEEINKENQEAKEACRINGIANRLHERMPTMYGLAHYCDLTHETLIQYAKDPIFSESLKLAKEKVEAMIAEGAGTGRYHSTFSIVNLKANFGWKDGSEENKTIIINDKRKEI